MERLHELRDIVKAAPEMATHYDQGVYYRSVRDVVLWWDWERGWEVDQATDIMRSLEDIKYIIHLLESIQFEAGV